MRSLSVICALVATAVWASSSRAAEGSTPPAPAAAPNTTRGFGQRGTYVHVFSALGYGRGLRWNNPYRLQTQLGDGPGSLSLTAGYWDISLGATLGAPNGLQHGAVLHLSVAANGVAQETLSVSYVAQIPFGQSALGYARAGVPWVLAPDSGVGLELAAGSVYFLTGGVGINAELVQSLFVGAGTWEHEPSLYPITSLQLGLWFDYEVLP
ncbi:MAG: hypothetical protein ACOY0T_23935 [Myxococcota bacterium]